jgi:hypothetical protein
LQLLARKRGVRNRAALPPLSIEQILAWADEHHQATGEWPSKDSGPIRSAPEDTWLAVANALYGGRRGLPKTSLIRLLAEQRGVKKVRRSGATGQSAEAARWPAGEAESRATYPALDCVESHEAGMESVAEGERSRSGLALGDNPCSSCPVDVISSPTRPGP